MLRRSLRAVPMFVPVAAVVEVARANAAARHMIWF